MIQVNKPFIPPLEEYEQYLKGIWDRHWLTNHGPLVLELEQKLAEYLGVKHLLYLNNGTIALQIALKAAAKPGKVITTPFSYVATTSSVVWEGYTPVFADIEPDSMNIDPEKVEALIDDEVTAILATHVYGSPCQVDRLQEISDKYGIPVIYDGAHAFGTHHNGKGILSYGDMATCSFHATKLFHTVEGGAIATNNDELAEEVKLMRNFGHLSSYEFGLAGVNGKGSEVHAAMGLVNFTKIEQILAERKRAHQTYDTELAELYANGSLRKPEPLAGWTVNKGYMAVVFRTEEEMHAVIAHLEAQNIFTRRYFYPSLNTLDYLETYQACPVSEDICSRVLCLPMYYDLTDEEIIRISSLIKEKLS